MDLTPCDLRNTVNKLAVLPIFGGEHFKKIEFQL